MELRMKQFYSIGILGFVKKKNHQSKMDIFKPHWAANGINLLSYFELVGKSGDTDHLNPVQTDHPKLTSFSCHKKVVLLC